MSIGGFTTTNYLTNAASPVVNASPWSVFLWFNDSLADGTQKFLVPLCRSGSNAVWAGLDVQSATARFTTNAATGRVTSSNTYSTGVWNSLGGVHTSNTMRSVYLNNTKMNSTTNTAGVANVPMLAIGARVGAAAQLPATGIIMAEIALWDVALTDDDMTMLSLATSPASVRPQNLRHYIPAIVDPIDYWTTPPTLTGTLTASAHPRIYK